MTRPAPVLKTLALQLLDNMKLREGILSDTEAIHRPHPADHARRRRTGVKEAEA